MNKKSMTEIYERSLLTKVVWMYYIEGMTQKSIADTIGVTRLKVIKMLEQARSENLIQFKIPVADRIKIETERQLITHFNLNDVFIVPTDDPDNTNESIAQAAAMYINDLIEDNAYINMGYGDTLGRVLNNLANISEKKLSIISMTGGVEPYLPNNKSHIFNAQLHLLPSPLLMSSAETAQSILLEEPIKEIMEMTNLAKISVVGIGGIDEAATIIKTQILSKNDFIKLEMKGAVGDILMHFIDKDGNLVASDIEEKLVSISLDKVKDFDNVIGVAAGINKIEAIQAALRGGYINTLITDEKTALQLLERV
ncbi:sugar-binding transcriptional regulator [Vagococcus lutrae]|uniref:Sugar-binding transcriptional regulator n=1 Tax=Vagococcus lutrae TaxID=81947 RepID=A0AAE9XFK8_9ENTE|nr:sugar-binding transcriptional regulator [Vagococcus lutrae]WCG22846.1 sugar-binding transcriptional regulator [Vagococcus lutrae]